ncbi:MULTISPECIES: cytochrome-c peroxidase [Methylomicrobium]|uniref:Cytochrome c peroxidase n=1 Tax=Methylomicrobium album BG8 TaxID=686340 RepID=H8GJR5_METAL|nr:MULTISPECIES: cytochrome c peroxidase [Methylomicrobium]EIC31594.1 cytochrome c peroxidase [Methylomicrobium album BG8]
MKLKFYALIAVAGGLAAAPAGAAAPILPGGQNLTPKQQLGQQLFFDTHLSEPPGQACATCHNPATAFTDADKSRPTSKGVIAGLLGNRNTPTAMYSAYAPAFHFDRGEGLYFGGQFLDGRASTLADQAKAPFLNPIEMANPDPGTVVDKVRNAAYAAMFDTVYGAGALNDNGVAYDRIADAIAAFERSPVLNRFSSKYDYYLFGRAAFTAQERRGLTVFEAGNKGNCAACHPNRPVNGTPPLFTDHSYDNIGVPKNPENPFYGLAPQFNPDGAYFVDLGLGGILDAPLEEGKIKVSTLRNVAVTAPYTHNGYFKTLRGVVEFYSTRDLKPRCRNPLTTEAKARAQKCWPAAEVIANVNHGELGSLRLTPREIGDLVAFLKTLTDGYRNGSPWQFKAP